MIYITLTEAKEQCRVDFDDDDAFIIDLVDMVEELVLSEVEGYVEESGYVTTAGTTALVGDADTTFTNYQVGDKIRVEGETIRTIATITDDNNLTVTEAFASTDDGLTFIMYPGISSPIPKPLKHAMKMMIAHFYNNRESTIIGVGMTEIPMGYKHLVNRYKNWTIK
jgi:hypothetical protein